jgi:translocation protein SEC63
MGGLTVLLTELDVLLSHSHVLLTSLLNITLARNWLVVSIYVMQLNARLAQAVKPSRTPSHDYSQYPSIRLEETQTLAEGLKKYKKGPDIDVISALVKKLEEMEDPRVATVEKAAERWCRLDIVDASFTGIDFVHDQWYHLLTELKVIGDKIITPGSYVNLVIKLRIAPPGSTVSAAERSKNDTSEENQTKDEQFLLGREESEPLQSSATVPLAHAPHWLGPRRPQWWVVVGDDKIGRVIVPPLKLGDVPYSDVKLKRNYRTWKMTFQAPPQIGVYSWRLRLVSDTYLGGEDYTRDLTVSHVYLDQMRT